MYEALYKQWALLSATLKEMKKDSLHPSTSVKQCEL